MHRPPQAARPGNGRLTPEQDARRQLRAEVTRLRMVRDRVKKALRVFVNEPRGGMP
jgi:hypothetical protein